MSGPIISTVRQSEGIFFERSRAVFVFPLSNIPFALPMRAHVRKAHGP
jgi:hypothetical protein